MRRSDIARQPLTVTVLCSMILMAAAAVAFGRLPAAATVVGTASVERLLAEAFAALPSWLVVLLWISSIGACSVAVTRIITRYSITITRTYLPVVFYVLVACGLAVPLTGIPAGGGFAGIFPASAPLPGVASVLMPPLLLAAASLQIESFRRSYQFGTFFRSAFYLGLLPVLYAPGAVFLLLVPITAVLYGRTGRELAIGAVGALLPLLLLSFVMWASGLGFAAVFSGLWDTFTSVGSLYATPFEGSIVSAVTAGVVALALVFGFIGVYARWRELRTRPRKVYRHFCWILVLGCAMMPFSDSGAAVLGVLAVPGSLLLTSIFLRERNPGGAVLYAALLVWVFLMNLLSY